MYNQVPPVTLAYPTSPSAAIGERPLDLAQLLRFLFSHAFLITAVTVLFVLAAVAYLVVTPPTFVSSAQLILDSQRAGSADVQQLQAEEAFVEGQIEIMKSADVLRSVVRSLDLRSDPEFVSTRLSMGEALRTVLFSRSLNISGDQADGDSSDEAAENRIVATLRSRIWVRRVGQSTVIEVSAASSEPQRAAAIANAVAETYIAHSVDMRSQAARRTSEWLSQRVADIREDVFVAERAVKEFQSSGDAASRFRLTELQSVADTYRRLYETYLQRWSETRQRISNPVADATFVSRAAVPISKSQPKSSLLLGFAFVLGFSMGVAAAVVHHFSNRLVSSPERIASIIGLPCLGEVAKVHRKQKKNGNLPELESQNPSGQRDQLFSRDMKDLKATLSGLRRNRKVKLIGVMGAEPKTGATTLAYNVTQLAAEAGSRTLLIDASAINPTLSRIFSPGKAIGLMELLNHSGAYSEFIRRVDKQLTVLPIGAFGEVTPGERVGSERIAFSFGDLKESFDLIVIDLPPMPQSADAKSIAPYLDGTIIVTRYGSTSFDTLNDVAMELRGVGAEILGVVLNASPRRRS